MNLKQTKFAVLGAGNAGHALSANLSLEGFSVNLYELPKFEENLDPIRRSGGITISGESNEGFAKLNKVTTEIEDALYGVDVIFVATPAFGQAEFFKTCAPHLGDDQIIIFISNFGALKANKFLQESDLGVNVILGETQSLLYSTRIVEPAHVKVFGVKNNLPVSTLPTDEVEGVIRRLSSALEGFVPAKNVFETSVNNPNPMLHPAMALLNAGRIESTIAKDWGIYKDGATRAVAKVMNQIDEERLAIAEKLNISTDSIKSTTEKFYGNYELNKENLSVLLQTNVVYDEIGAPDDIGTRYITEDVPYGLVPLYSIAEMWEISTPVITSIIRIASAVEGLNYFEKGVKVADLGIDGLTPEQAVHLVDC